MIIEIFPSTWSLFRPIQEASLCISHGNILATVIGWFPCSIGQPSTYYESFTRFFMTKRTFKINLKYRGITRDYVWLVSFPRLWRFFVLAVGTGESFSSNYNRFFRSYSCTTLPLAFEIWQDVLVVWRWRMKNCWGFGVWKMIPLAIWWTTWNERNRKVLWGQRYFLSRFQALLFENFV